MDPVSQPSLPHRFVRFGATTARVAEQVAAANELQTAVVLGLESIQIAERQSGVRLGIILGRPGDAASVVAGADLVAVPRPARIPGRPRQKL